MATFIEFKQKVQDQIKYMSDFPLFASAISSEEIWDTYLGSFPAGSNPMFRERTEHDCNCCKNFIRNIGNMLAVKDNQLISIFDIEIEEPFKSVANALSLSTKHRGIANIYLHTEKKIGTEKTPDMHSDIVWDHFFTMTPIKVITEKDKIGTKLGHATSNKSALQRSIEEISDEAVDTVIELIEQGSLYRGEEHLSTVKLLRQCKQKYEKADNKDIALWEMSASLGLSSKIKNSVIGTLMEDVSSGVDLEKAVKSFESKVAPYNYKRPKAIVTEGMIKKAQKTVEELGISKSLNRRHANINDISINDIIFADRSAKKEMNVFDELISQSKKSSKKFDHVESISIEDFISKFVPYADEIELMLENKNEKNLVTLVAPENADAPNILKWDNNFSWTYNGEVADSLRDQVKSLGGRVDGALRFSHAWNYDKNKKNQSLMDLHVFTPACGHVNNKNIHDSYPKAYGRVGWNSRSDSVTGGVQDVDFINPPEDDVPIENITFPDLCRLPNGEYHFKIHNWNARLPNDSGFKAEIEFGGEVFEYEYEKPLKHKEWVTVATAIMKDGLMTFDHKIQNGKQVKQLWNLNTQNFHKVKLMMLSPNHWSANKTKTGNKHYFFMLEDCKNPDKVRGFYNELLTDSLNENRKVFELLASKMKAEYNEDQLSGVGFSSTKYDSVIIKVKGSFERVLKIEF